MNFKIKIFVFFIIILSLLTYFSCKKRESEKKIIVATDATWPPMEMVNEKKEIVGFDIDLFKEIAKAANFKVEFRNTAWDGIFSGLENNEYDAIISSVTITEERKQKYDFSDPYINAGQVLIIRAQDNYMNLVDLKDKNVGAQIGTTGAFEIQKIPEIKLKTYDELGLAIEDLVNNKIDAVVADTPIAANYVLQNINYKDKLKIPNAPFTEEYYGIVVKKGNTEILEKINQGLKKVKESGIDKKLIEKWLR